MMQPIWARLLSGTMILRNPDDAVAAAEAATEAAHATEEAVRETNMNITEAVVEAAQERVDEATETAERIAESAMQSELGRRIGVLEEATLWLGENGGRADLENQIRLLRENNASLETRLLTAEETIAALQSSPVPILAPKTEDTSILPPLPETGEVVEPSSLETPPSVAVVVPAPAPPAKRRLKLL